MPNRLDFRRALRAMLLALSLSVLCARGSLADPRDNGPVTVPITLHGVHIFVRATIDSNPVTLVLDTGAGGNVITPQAAARLKLVSGKSKTAVSGAGGNTASVSQVDVAALGVGAAVSEKQTAYLIPLPEGLKCDGLLGTPFLAQWIVTIDYARLQLTLTPRVGFTPPADTTSFALSFPHNTPHIQAVADGCKGSFQIDTGAGDAVTLFGPFVDRNHLRSKYTPSLQMITGRGIGGLITSDVVRLPNFSIGSFQFSGPVAELSRQTAGAFADEKTAGNLGGEIWKRFTVTLDYLGKKIYLAPNGHYGEPFIGNRSGLGIDFVNGAFSVIFVAANSPASEAGILVGDKLLAIDDMPAELIEAADLSERMRGAVGAQLKLRLRTGDQPPRETILTLRDLL